MPPKRTKGPKTSELGALGDAVLQLRKEAKLSQEALAASSGLHVTHIRAIERGARNPTYSSLRRLCDGLGIPLTALVTLAAELED